MSQTDIDIANLLLELSKGCNTGNSAMEVDDAAKCNDDISQLVESLYGNIVTPQDESSKHITDILSNIIKTIESQNTSSSPLFVSPISSLPTP